MSVTNREGGVAKICDQQRSPQEGACLRHGINRDRQMRGMFKICDESGSLKEGAS